RNSKLENRNSNRHFLFSSFHFPFRLVMKLSLSEIAATLAARTGAPDKVVLGYSIDSRTILPHQLFFAIRGPRFDGHDFVGRALERGAAGAVVSNDFAAKADSKAAPALIAVADPTRALQDLARAVRRKWGERIIAITGSAGKTTTKELTAAILSRKFSVLKSPGNLNNYYGLPLALLALEPSHDVAVVELAMSAAGEIAMLAGIAEPQIGVVTNVAPVHLQFFDSVDSIARAKRELIENLSPPATAILNHDDLRVRQFAEGFKGRTITYGFDAGAAFRAGNYSTTPNHGSRFSVKAPMFEREFWLPLAGRHNVRNALAAIAASSNFEVPHEMVAEALAQPPTLHQRSEILALPGDVTVVNDSYNSNPLAMEQMLETLAAWPRAARRIVVAGEMLELGSTSPDLHRDIGRRCAERGVDCLLAVQGDAKFIVQGAVEAGLSPERAFFFTKPEEAAERCLALLRPGDVVLVKGSRGEHLEKVIELLQSSSEALASRSGPKGK
ncbi:MAG TPA: UDP-N-acetylmuramoyl-tripeptide--D-alanyl-D-alanine ligase, partial [Terriglobia bacterium]|nr:UDP-N-acetylmuramoyl-tripeptide--D-alanyl-D-alanine ligase [Terriglobia bacterium]